MDNLGGEESLTATASSWRRSAEDDRDRRRVVDTTNDFSEAPENSASRSNHPSSRSLVVLAFLFILGIALSHAVASGYESTKRPLGTETNNISSSNDKRIVNEKSEQNPLSATTPADEEEKMEGITTAVLTRASQLSVLIAQLDASDVVEVYVVTRLAHLSNMGSKVGAGSTGGNGNGKIRRILDESKAANSSKIAVEPKTVVSESMRSSPQVLSMSGEGNINLPSGPVRIHKPALAFRYRPRVVSHEEFSSSSSSPHEHRKYFELTLEYGPERTGATRTFESLPVIQMDTELMAEAGNDDFGKFATWSNDGRVYYSTHISDEWSDAYYMTSITGVVVEKIIQRAAEYNNKRPRYQPFEVISKPSGKLLLKSSSADDFVWEMFHDLADLYVEIDPLLVPARGRVQFYVSDPDENEINEQEGDQRERLIGGDETNGGDKYSKTKTKAMNPNVQMVTGTLEASRAAVFYEKFANCASAIKTGDYSMYLAPTSAPTASVTEEFNVTAHQHRQLSSSEKTQSSLAPLAEIDWLDSSNNITNNITPKTGGNDDKNDDISDISRISGDTLMNSTEIAEDGNTLDKIDNSTIVIDGDCDNAVEPVEDAADAAIEAAEAAENAVAVVQSNTTSAADTAAATSEAAKAAQKAKEASVAARSKSFAEALLSGDGVLMTSVLSNCFSDPKYGIRVKEVKRLDAVHVDRNELIEDDDHGVERKDLIIAYIYVDGNVFFRLNLTSPYWGVYRSLETVPPPQLHPEGKGDVVDWTIFFLILSGTLFGILVMLHQTNIVVIDKRLRFRRFFHPTKSDSDAIFVLDWEKLKLAGKGGGFPHADLFLTLEAIPESMGGSRSKSPSDLYHDLPQSPLNEQDGSIDLELAQFRSSTQHIVSPIMRASLSDFDQQLQLHPMQHSEQELPSSLRRKRDTPDLVERPSSKTNTKVSYPKQSPKREAKLLYLSSPPMDLTIVNDTPPPELPKGQLSYQTPPSGTLIC